MKCTVQINKPVTGVWADSAFGGIEIIGDIEYGITNYIYWRFNYEVPEDIHRAKIYLGKRPYFRTSKGRIYLDNVVRV